mgnify:FL=1
MNNRLRTQLMAEKKAFDVFEMKYLSPDDKKVISYVGRAISNIKTSAIVTRENAILGEVFAKSLDNLRIFDDSFYFEALKFASVRFVPTFPDSFSFSCYVAFYADDKTMKPIVDSGKVDHFKIPQIIDTNAEVHLTHELIHAIKETNFEEYKLVAILSDVIPIFYELIGTEKDEQLRRDILNMRVSVLGIESITYKNATMNMKKNMHEKDLYRVMQNRSGQYLNSFYYALILYNMYKFDKERIIGAINRVLRREITTLDMLIELGIYTKDNNHLFDEELEEIMKVLK